MTALPSHYYQDPAKWYEQQEQRTCKGCVHRTTLFNRPMCAKARKSFPRKCGLYKEAE